MMRFIPSESCSNTMTTIPPTLSSVLSSFTYQSYNSIDSVFRRLNYNGDDMGVDDDDFSVQLPVPSSILSSSIVPSSIVSSSIVPSLIVSSSIVPLSIVSSSLLPFTPADYDGCLNSYNQNSNSDLSDRCHTHITSGMSVAVKIESSSPPMAVLPKKKYRTHTFELHDQPRRKYYSRDSKISKTTTKNSTAATATGVTMVTIIPTIVPTTPKRKLPMASSRSKKRTKANITNIGKPSDMMKLKTAAITTVRSGDNSSHKMRNGRGAAKNKDDDDTDTDDNGPATKKNRTNRITTIKRRTSEHVSNPNTAAAVSAPIQSSVLDDWQRQFLKFITYPSDHILTLTGTMVPLRKTIVWGRQKVVWTGTRNTTMTAKDGEPIVTHQRRYMIPARMGGNHLSQQLVVKAALATVQRAVVETDHHYNNVGLRTSESSFLQNTVARSGKCVSDAEMFAVNDFTEFETINTSKKAPNKMSELLMIRRNKEEALWFHGGTNTNQRFGEWLKNERAAYRKQQLEPKARNIQAAASNQRHPPGHRRKDRKNCAHVQLSKSETDERYKRYQESFQFHLLELVGMDLQSVPPDDTIFHGKYCKPL